ncbi:MAG: hypothetical protein CMB73_02935 [Euryarchaeota archaeon]|nr:hypothetical protein [Euryarchaeota archaeon]
MTMHLVRGMSSLNTKKRKANRQPGWEKAQAEHDAYLMKMGVHPSQLKNKEKSSGNEIPNYKVHRSVPTSDRICTIAPKAKRNVYSGDYVTGLATMHKSNIVPVGRGTDPKEYAQMRRS